MPLCSYFSIYIEQLTGTELSNVDILAHIHTSTYHQIYTQKPRITRQLLQAAPARAPCATTNIQPILVWA